MTSKRRNALAALAMTAAGLGAAIGLGVTSAGAAPATHHVFATTKIRASPSSAAKVRLSSAATSTKSSPSASTRTVTPATKKGPSTTTGKCPNMGPSTSSSATATTA